MTDTPRTDALEDQYFENRNHVSEVFLHAQQLERELAAAIASFNEERERAQREGERMIKLQVKLAESVAAERERCAKVCETGVDTEHPTVKGHIMKNFGVSSHLAAAIRKGE